MIVGPVDAATPLIVAIDHTGTARSWTVPELTPGPSVSAQQPQSLAVGELRTGLPYLAIGGARGAAVWRLDAAADPPPGLHDGDTLRVARIERPKPLVLTVGNDGAVRVWDECDQRSTTLAIPTGGVNDLVCWTEGDTSLVAVTSVNVMQVFDAGTAAVGGEFEFPGGRKGRNW